MNKSTFLSLMEINLDNPKFKFVRIDKSDLDYTFTRADIMQTLEDDELSTLFRRENETQRIAYPWEIFRMKFKSLRHYQCKKLSDDEKSFWYSAIYRLKPKDEAINSDEYYRDHPEICPIVDFFHVWDGNIRITMHNISQELTKDIRKTKEED